MNNSRLSQVLIASLCLNVGFIAAAVLRQAQPPRPGPGPGGPPPFRMEERLELTEAQRRAVDEAREELRERLDAARAELRREHARLGELLAVEAPDRQAIDAQLNKVAEVQRRSQELVINHILSVQTRLDPDQRQVFRDSLLGQVLGGRGPRGGRGERPWTGQHNEFGGPGGRWNGPPPNWPAERPGERDGESPGAGRPAEPQHKLRKGEQGE